MDDTDCFITLSNNLYIIHGRISRIQIGVGKRKDRIASVKY